MDIFIDENIDDVRIEHDIEGKMYLIHIVK